MNSSPNRRRAVACIAALGLLAAACGDDDAASTAAATTAAEDGSAFPFTFTNCGREFTLDAAPERVLLMEAAVPSLLFAAGAMDRVVARIEDFPAEHYTPEEMEVLDAIPALQAEATSTVVSRCRSRRSSSTNPTSSSATTPRPSPPTHSPMSASSST